MAAHLCLQTAALRKGETTKFIFIEPYMVPFYTESGVKSASRKVSIRMTVPLIDRNNKYLIFPNPKIPKIKLVHFILKRGDEERSMYLNFCLFHGKSRL